MLAGLALLSSLLWGSADYLGGNLAKRFASLAVTGASQFMGLLLGIGLLSISSGWRSPDLSWRGYFVSGAIAGAAGFIGLVSYYAGLSTGKMGVVAPITSLSAIIPVFYGVLQGERPGSLQIVGMVIAILGCFAASGPELQNGVSARPVLLGVLTALMFGIALVFMARGARVDSLMTMTTMRLVTFAVVVVIAVRMRSIGGFKRVNIPILVVIGVSDFLANYLLGVATTKGLISVAMVLGSIFPVVTTLLAFFFLGERLQRIQYVGVVTAITGVALISLG